MACRSVLIRILQTCLLVTAVIFVFYYLREQWQTFQSEKLEIDWGVFLIAQVGMVVSMGIFPVCAWLTLGYLNEKRPKTEIWYFFYLSSIAKYLPGSVWALPGRVYLYRSNNIPLGLGVPALFWEIGIMVISAGLLGLLTMPLIAFYISRETINVIFIAIIAAISLVGLGSAILYPRSKSMSSFFAASEVLNAKNTWLTFPQILTIFMVFVCSWCLLGGSFWLVVRAVYPATEINWLVPLIGLFSGTWMAGFLVIIAPGGIGVRDALIVLGLAVFLTQPLPVVIAVLARIAWTISEVVGLAISSLTFHFLSTHRSANN